MAVGRRPQPATCRRAQQEQLHCDSDDVISTFVHYMPPAPIDIRAASEESESGIGPRTTASLGACTMGAWRRRLAQWCAMRIDVHRWQGER